MSFFEELKEFATKIEQQKDMISTEEATKTSIVLPFFQLLGYDIFNPLEFIPEFTADTGIKKGEKVDYAIMKNNEPIIIIEVKPINTSLNSKHINQLFRYFTVTKSRFAILTNGIIYKFYSDLDESNKMDLSPFLEINLQNLKQSSVKELGKFTKDNFNIKGILDSASELKYTSLLKEAISEQIENPSDQFIKLLLKNIYTGTKTQNVIDKFRTLTCTAFEEYVNELLNERFQNAMVPTNYSLNEPENLPEKIYDFLPIETKTLDYVKSMLNVDDVSFKKTSRYAYLHIKGFESKWICRIYKRQENNLFILRKFPNFNFETEYIYDTPDQLDVISDLITNVYNNYK